MEFHIRMTITNEKVDGEICDLEGYRVDLSKLEYANALDIIAKLILTPKKFHTDLKKIRLENRKQALIRAFRSTVQQLKELK